MYRANPLRFLQSYSKSMKVKCSPRVFFLTVSQTELYSQFIPWCRRSKIVEYISERQNMTELWVSFSDLHELSYTSRVSIQESPEKYEVLSVCSESPLEYLQSYWSISKAHEEETLVEYRVSYKFQSVLYDMTSSLFLNLVGQSMWDTFVARAQAKPTTPHQPQTEAYHQTANSLQIYLQSRPQIFILCSTDSSFAHKVKSISAKLLLTQNYSQKMDFEIRYLLHERT